MCFTPIISLSTAIIEFTIATFILIKYKNYFFPVFWAILIYVLGFYQLTEFMLCKTIYQTFWATLGFSASNFLPAIALHFSLRITKSKFPKWILYIIPSFVFTVVLFERTMITGAACLRYFIVVGNIFTKLHPPTIYSILYLIYYFGYIVLILFMLFKYAKKTKNIDKIIIYITAISIAIITIAPVILMILLPSLGIIFPSIYCEFALLFSIVALITCSYYNNKKRKELF